MKIITFKFKIFSLIIILILISTIFTINTDANPSSCESGFLQKDVHYYSHEELTDLLENLNQEYSDIFMYESLGKSHEGRDLWFVKISDNVEINESEPGVLYTGGMHGNEKPGYQNVIFSIISILENYTSSNVNHSFTNQIRNIVNNSQLFFVPMVNPDGCEANRRKNSRQNKCLFGKTLLRGVDIGRNFDYNWEDADKHPLRYILIPRTIKDLWFVITHKNFYLFERGVVRYPLFDFKSIIGYGFYRGPHPFSEPETRALKYVLENHSISIAVDYHIFGEEIRYYDKNNYHHPSDADTFYSIAENISKVNAYELFQYPKFFNTSGMGLDWIYAELGIFSFIIELCPSFEV